MERNFKGIWIPKEIWLSKELTLQEKVFLVEIDSLDNEEGCFAGNAYFADFFGISKTRVSLVIKSLIDKKFITSTIIYKEGTKQILKRVLKVYYRPYLTNVKDPIQQMLKDNNTSSNTSNNTTNTNKAEIENFFEECWKMYPKKKGKGSVSDSKKKVIYKLGEEFKTAIERYKKELELNKTEIRYTKDGSTFFNSGYVDYLDENYESINIKKTTIKKDSEIRKTQEQIELEELLND